MTADSPPPEVPPIAGEPYTPPPPPPYVYPTMRQRPLGVTLLAILEALSGVFLILTAIGSFIIAGVANMQDVADQLGPDFPQEFIDMAPILFGVMGVILVILAIIAFLLTYGFLKGRGWAWTLAMVLVVLSIIFSIVGWFLSGFNPAGLASMLIGILIPLVVLLYLNMNNVRAWFGKA